MLAALWSAVIGGFMLWIGTLGKPPGAMVILNYLALIAWCLGCAALIQRRWLPWRFFRYSGCAVGLLAVAIYLPFDRYTIRAAGVWDAETMEWTQFRLRAHQSLPEDAGILWADMYTRWGSKHIYRQVRWLGDPKSLDDVGPLIRVMEGPMIGSTGSHGRGKPHGRWTYRYQKPHKLKDGWFWWPTKVEHTWYWYGEDVSEGEWHLRNK